MAPVDPCLHQELLDNFKRLHGLVRTSVVGTFLQRRLMLSCRSSFTYKLLCLYTAIHSVLVMDIAFKSSGSKWDSDKFLKTPSLLETSMYYGSTALGEILNAVRIPSMQLDFEDLFLRFDRASTLLRVSFCLVSKITTRRELLAQPKFQGLIFSTFSLRPTSHYLAASSCIARARHGRRQPPEKARLAWPRPLARHQKSRHRSAAPYHQATRRTRPWVEKNPTRRPVVDARI